MHKLTQYKLLNSLKVKNNRIKNNLTIIYIKIKLFKKKRNIFLNKKIFKTKIPKNKYNKVFNNFKINKSKKKNLFLNSL
jgi:hypothetical protein